MELTAGHYIGAFALVAGIALWVRQPILGKAAMDVATIYQGVS